MGWGYRRYNVYAGDEVRLCFGADLTEASAPVFIIDQDTGQQESTGLQTADAAGHDADEMAYALNEWLHSEGGAAFGDEETIQVRPADHQNNPEEPCEHENHYEH